MRKIKDLRVESNAAEVAPVVQSEEADATPAPVAPVNVEPPADDTPSGPKFKAGDRVENDRGDSGEVIEMIADPYSYKVKCAAGEWMMPECALKPGTSGEATTNDGAATPEDDMEKKELEAENARLTAENAALKSETSSKGEQIDGLNREVLSLELDRAGVKSGIKDLLVTSLAKPEGQTWREAVEADKAKRGADAYEAKSAAPAVEAPKSDMPTMKPDPVAEIVPQSKAPVGSGMPSRDASGDVATDRTGESTRGNVVKSDKDELESFFSELDKKPGAKRR